KVICLDPSPIAVEYCKSRGLELVFQSTIDDFYLLNQNLKAVCALDVIEHIDDDLGTLKKLYNLLEDNGKLLVTVPAYQWLWSNHDVLHMHRRRYTKKHLLRVLNQSGFQVIYISYFNFFLFIPAVIKRFLSKKSNIENQPPVDPVSNFVNKVLTKIFLFEKFFLPRVRFPFGLSIIAIAKKNG
ncbi:MAG: class I SAM-dependent methyltransferase, partial [Candidatus Kapaibacteriota bacterium]